MKKKLIYFSLEPKTKKETALGPKQKFTTLADIPKLPLKLKAKVVQNPLLSIKTSWGNEIINLNQKMLYF